jgi:hypothetical protein
MRTAPSHKRCLAAVCALNACSSADTQGLGDDFPFVVGAIKTNGIQTMAAYVLAMCAREEYNNTNLQASEAAGLCVALTPMWHLLTAVALLDRYHVLRDKREQFMQLATVASHAKLSGEKALHTLATAATFAAFRDVANAAVPGVTRKMLASLECDGERCALMFKQVVELHVARCTAKIRDTCTGIDDNGRLNSKLEMARTVAMVPTSLQFNVA